MKAADTRVKPPTAPLQALTALVCRLEGAAARASLTRGDQPSSRPTAAVVAVIDHKDVSTTPTTSTHGQAGRC